MDGAGRVVAKGSHMRYDERITAVIGYLRVAKHGVEIRALLEKLKMIYPDGYASAYRMFRRDVRQFNGGVGHALGYSIHVAHRPAQCSLAAQGSSAP